MALGRRGTIWLALGAAGLSIAIPVVAQQAPESLLPPGFGDPSPERPTPAPSPTQRPSAPGTPAPAPGQPPATVQQLPSGPSVVDFGMAQPGTDNAVAEAELSDEELAAQKAKYDLPDSARRSLDRIGPLTPDTGGYAPNVFGNARGQYMTALMRTMHAPVASRWASILARRMLLSATDTPADINGADWTAERAWLLLRMGEADSARLLVQSVDPDKYTARLYAVAMQVYLATADPAGFCPLSDGALRTSQSPSWKLSKGICAALSGDQGTASSVLNQAERQGTARGIDYRLAEKTVGAGFNGRRSVKIEWDGVSRLTPWRYGLATAMNVDIPPELFRTVGRQVLAWQGRAAMLAPGQRLRGAEMATALGVFSGAALVDLYGEINADPDAPVEAKDRADLLRTAFTGNTVGSRIDAMRSFWSTDNGVSYPRLVALSRAAASLPVAAAEGPDVPLLIAAMLGGGYDRNAARWAQVVPRVESSGGEDAWALLAVGAPSPVVELGSGRVTAYLDAVSPFKAQMLVAGLAGLNRINAADTQRLAGQVKLDLAYQSRWTRAIDDAAAQGNQGLVSLLAIVGLQASGWNRIPPQHLYHIVAALHRAGLDPEARMIAAEAIARL